ncbi:hypothetical protein LZ31DRAFT_171394 [Colletotrichum somersetense]|nr:hypothetical protein LZ31DRAFT_171394 [Colletotrichum somersetense]
MKHTANFPEPTASFGDQIGVVQPTLTRTSVRGVVRNFHVSSLPGAPKRHGGRLGARFFFFFFFLSFSLSLFIFFPSSYSRTYSVCA